MSKSRLEMKVGLFVFIGLGLLAVLLMQFGKGISLFRPTYAILLTTKSAGGLKKQAGVLMSGVPVGTVSDIKLSPDGTYVTITLTIYKEFVIRQDALFLIKQSGFLGDNYIEINPLKNEGDPFPTRGEPGRATAQEPFDLQEVARSAAGFIQRVDDAAKKLNDAISDVRRLALNEQTLTNLSITVGTMRTASERAVSMIDGIDTLFATNGEAISRSASNLVVFSEGLNNFSDKLNGILATNREGISASVKNIESSSVALKTILDDVQAGKGPVGTLLRNEQVSTNIAEVVQNLSITSSNLNRLGLWRFLWHRERPPGDAPPAKPLVTPKKPFD
jgi:phospholipid/cholesterol/gamma-HCH transport system substrate-binding protein